MALLTNRCAVCCQQQFPMCKITAPIIGAALVLRGGLRLPFLCSVGFMLAQLALSFFVAGKETRLSFDCSLAEMNLRPHRGNDFVTES